MISGYLALFWHSPLLSQLTYGNTHGPFLNDLLLLLCSLSRFLLLLCCCVDRYCLGGWLTGALLIMTWLACVYIFIRYYVCMYMACMSYGLITNKWLLRFHVHQARKIQLRYSKKFCNLYVCVHLYVYVHIWMRVDMYICILGSALLHIFYFI